MIRAIHIFFIRRLKRWLPIALPSMLFDTLSAFLCLPLALLLRLAEGISDYPYDWIFEHGVMMSVMTLGIFHFFGIYRSLWQYTSLHDLLTLIQSVSLVILLYYTLLNLQESVPTVPRSVPIIMWLVLLFLTAGARTIKRLFHDYGVIARLNPASSATQRARIPVLMLGTGNHAESFIRNSRHQSEYHVIGLLSDKKKLCGRQIHGVPVLGTWNDMDQVIADLRQKNPNVPQKIILAQQDMNIPKIEPLLNVARQYGLELSRLPRIGDLEKHSLLSPQPIDLDDLLGRHQVFFEKSVISHMIAHRVVAVTGAGGSIGSELCRQIAAFSPAHLVMIDHSEHELYHIDRQMADQYADIERSTHLIDICDRAAMKRLIANFSPDILFHGAALKHVGMIENNPLAAIRVNAAGSQVVCDLCREGGVGVTVLISTDKAVHPSSIMGATKRLAERYACCTDRESSPKHRCIPVRFGNVIGSRGSAIPLFSSQIARGGPVTITDRRAERFFMSIREAVTLVLQSAAICTDQSPGGVYVLDMGKAVPILHVAQQMIRLAGYEPDKDIPIHFTGLKKGEKLREALFHHYEKIEKTSFESIVLAQGTSESRSDLSAVIGAMNQYACDGEQSKCMALLRKTVPEYNPDPEE